MAVVPFTQDEVKKYLDDCIKFWRKKQDGKGNDAKMAIYYIDAFQSVRISIFGDTLP